jgi:hypothetical protein
LGRRLSLVLAAYQDNAADQQCNAEQPRQVDWPLWDAEPAEVIKRECGDHLSCHQQRDVGGSAQLWDRDDRERDEDRPE